MAEVASTEIPSTSELPASIDNHDQLMAIIVIICVDVVASVVSITVNTTTIAAMVTFKLYKKAPSNIFIFSLCISDFFLGLAFLQQKLCHVLVLLDIKTVALRLGSWIGSALGHFALFNGFLGVILIGLDRAIAISMPHSHSKLLTTKTAVVSVLTTWTIASVVNSSAVLTMAFKFSSIHDLPVVVHPAQTLPPKYVTYCAIPLSVFFLVCCAAIYCVVIIFFFKAKKKINANSSSSERKAQQMTRMVIAIVSVLLLFNCPILISAALIRAEQTDHWHLVLLEVCALLSVFPSFINNFMYTSHIDIYKRAHLRLLPCYGRNVVGVTPAAHR